jgi:hypothetical protein
VINREPNGSSPSVQDLHEAYGVHLKLAQYPILAGRIRELMRRELFSRGVLTVDMFEREVRQKAIISQHREGLQDPFAQEPEKVWARRLAVIRDQLTDYYFANNMPHERLDELIKQVMASRSAPSTHELDLTFNPELAPLDLLFAQGEAYESLPPEDRKSVRHHLQEIIVVLIKSLLSDQLEFIGIAKEVFTIRDLIEIRRRCIGRGKIGGKAAGMLLAQKILQTPDPQDGLAVHEHVQIPDSYFLGADVHYDFQLVNDYTHYMNQKYRSREDIENDYPKIRQAYMDGHFPGEIIYGLRRILEEVGNTPLVVRSSSLLEVYFGAALAGKYKSVFCPNQGTLDENLEFLMNAIAQVYASTLSPDALLYRQHMGLVDYDERMAVLIQKAEGQRYHDYFFPTLAGVGYSRNPFRWSPKIRREDGFLRLVVGFGTRAVDRVSHDYPHLVALSHPQLRPYIGLTNVRKYSQHYIDVADLERNAIVTLPIHEVIEGDFPGLRYLASVDKREYISPIVARLRPEEARQIIITFDNLMRDRRFIDLMRTILDKLERYHHWPVDIEFTVEITPRYPHAEYTVHILQCRPLNSRTQSKRISLPEDVPEEDLILRTTHLVPQGAVEDIRYLIYVDPRAYSQAPSYETKTELARAIGRLNKRLQDERFMLIGPGRWGSSDPDLGVKISYADIFNTQALVEIPLLRGGSIAEPSYGTHFFQDLIEQDIYPLSVPIGEDGAELNTDLIRDAPNKLADISPEDADFEDTIQVIDLPEATDGRTMSLVMDDEEEIAIGYLKPKSETTDLGTKH